MSEALKGVADAHNRYFDAIHSKPNRTGDDEVRLYREIVTPADAKLNAVINSSLKATADSIVQQSKHNREILTQEIKDNANGKPWNGSAAGSSKRSKSAAPTAPDTSPAKPETVLDGSGIAKEIEFKGKASKNKKPVKAKAPAVQPAPAETVVPAKPIPAPSGGVNELSFPSSLPAANPGAGPVKK